MLYSREWNRVTVPLFAQADVSLVKGKPRVFRTFPDRDRRFVFLRLYAHRLRRYLSRTEDGQLALSFRL